MASKTRSFHIKQAWVKEKVPDTTLTCFEMDTRMHPEFQKNKESHNLFLTRPGSVTAIVSALFALGLAGCGNNDTSTAEQAPPTIVVAPPASPAATPTPPGSDTNAGPGGATGTNAALAEEINTKIVRNTQMTGSRVIAIVDDAGVATLNGFVQNQQQKALAAKAAQNTSGVTSVKNKLEIRPTGGTGKTPKPSLAPPTTNIIVVPSGSSNPPAAPPAPPASPAPGEGTTPAATPTPDPNATPLGGYTAPG